MKRFIKLARLKIRTENIFETHDKGLVSRIYKELLQNKKESFYQVKTRQWRPDWPLQGETQMTNKYMKKCPISLVIREIQIKPQ